MSSVAETTTETRLYEQHSAVVLRYCLRTLGSREDAEDAAQTTFFQAVRALRRGVVPTFEQAWLLTIAKNECLSRHRANGRRRRLELVRDPQTLEQIAEAPSGGDGTLIGVQSALGRLPETQRRALLLREWQGCSYSEIALELDTTLPAVEALLFRARRGLARELGEERKTRRHALDIASLLAALKSVLGGGVAVKAAAGIAAVATVGMVGGGAEQRTPARAPVVPAKQVVVTPVAEAQTPAKPLVTRRPDSQPGRAGSPKAKADRAGIARPDEAGSKPAPGSATANPSAPAAPAAPRSDQVAPAPQPPATAPVETPTLPPVPSAPEAPKVELPQLPVELPQLLEVQLPELPLVPELPEVPIVSDLPIVDDLPIVGDLLP